MISIRLASAVALLCIASVAFAAFTATAPKDANLAGHWQVNVAKSDDAEQLLQERLDELRRQSDRFLREANRTDALGIPPLGLPPPPPEEEPEAKPPPGTPPQQRRPRRNDNLRRMLNISDTLSITQSGAVVDIVSQLDTRRFEAGSRSQVSMPTGELADSNIGWDGQWFTIERRAKRGPRVVERYRWLKRTDQLESEIKWSGDTLLSGIKVHRIYDRMANAPVAPDPDAGPVR